MSEHGMTSRDIDYIEGQYVELGELCRRRGWPLAAVLREIGDRRLPAPSYQLPDGRRMVPRDYFDLAEEAGGVDQLASYFAGRYGESDDFYEVWEAYLDGIWGVCLRRVTPENIRRKGQLVELLQKLLADPAPQRSDWAEHLVAAVEELDGLERPFSPDYDRVQFGRPPTRDTLIAEPRRRYAELFERAGAEDVA